MIEIVIARYDEDLNWLIPYSKQFKITIYNKGPEIEQSLHNEFFDVINLQNIGREAHSYLIHIVKNYGKMDDVVLFLQGRISDEMDHVYEHPHMYVDEALKYGFSAKHISFYSPVGWFHDFDPSKIPTLQKLPPGQLDILEYIREYIGPIPPCTTHSLRGCFAASSESISSRPLEFYIRLLKSIPEINNPVEIHYLERLWGFIFSRNKNLMKLFGLPDYYTNCFLNG
jgi:hypothetical protein